jgi:hypothetical protein
MGFENHSFRKYSSGVMWLIEVETSSAQAVISALRKQRKWVRPQGKLRCVVPKPIYPWEKTEV